MASIGGITFITVRGRVTPIAQTVESFERDGIDGHGLQQIGKRAPRCTLIATLDVSDAAAVATHINACLALAGTLVTVVHDDGTTVLNVAVMSAPEFMSSKKVVTPVGGTAAGTFLVTTRWTVQATQ